MSTRLHGPWKRHVEGVEDEVETWHGQSYLLASKSKYTEAIFTRAELARPQIHGYPLASIAFTDRLQFVSGADEKIVRVFDAPRMFVTTVERLSGVEDLGDAVRTPFIVGQEHAEAFGQASRPVAANVPPLGLSNRAIASTSTSKSRSNLIDFATGNRYRRGRSAQACVKRPVRSCHRARL